MKKLIITIGSISKRKSSIAKTLFKIICVLMALIVVTLFVFYPVSSLTETSLRIGLFIYNGLWSLVGLSFWLMILVPTVMWLCEMYVKDNYSWQVMEILPGKYLADATWVHTVESMINARGILSYAEGQKGFSKSKLAEYRRNLSNDKPRNLFNFTYVDFIKGNYDPKDVKKDKKENDVYASLWLTELTKSPLLERISVLYQIDTPEKRKTFAQRPIEDLEEFFEPFNEFTEFIKEYRTSVELQRKMFKEQIKSMKEQKLKNEMDELFKYGMTRMDEMQTVEKPSHPLD